MSERRAPLGAITWEDRTTSPQRKDVILLYPNDTILVGRDKGNNDLVLQSPFVSGCQFEIYSIIVDEEYKHPPLAFVRDRGSSNGTCVNGQLIGKHPRLSQARILEHGDVVTIGRHPGLAFTYVQLLPSRPSYTLSAIQKEEVELFKNRFNISDRTIGDGGHSLVFLAKDTKSGEHVACKVYDISRFSPQSRQIEKIRQEAALLSTLDHPNVLPIRAAFETRQTIYLITDFATGGDVYSLLMKHGTMEEIMIRSIVRQILRGLAYIHSKGVAHRDIKPENILCGITPRAPYRIMLSDFGSAAAAGRRRMKSRVGTDFYRAPECHGDQGYDFSADIWGVGLVALQLLFGYNELPGFWSVRFGSQTEVDNYIDEVFGTLAKKGRAFEAGERFVRACLTYKSQKRPTAVKALYHDWLQTPEADKRTFEDLEAENVRSWKPQPVKFPVIENLTEKSVSMKAPGSILTSGVVTLYEGVSPHFAGSQEADAVFELNDSIEEMLQPFALPIPPTDTGV